LDEMVRTGASAACAKGKRNPAKPVMAFNMDRRLRCVPKLLIDDPRVTR
jgi:hypothetical protein